MYVIVALQNTTTGDPATPTSHPFESLSLATKVVIYVVALLLAGGFVIIACSCLVGACFCGKPCWYVCICIQCVSVL